MPTDGRTIQIVGSGGREHALALALSKSPHVARLIAAPGNAGFTNLATLCDVASDDLSGQVALAQQEKADLVIVGPEDPLAAGLVDMLTDADIRAFGPSARAAQLEGSKVFSKNFMRDQGIPTSEYEVFTNPGKAIDYIQASQHLVVVKASGLAAGKGVIVPNDNDEAITAVEQIMRERVFGDAGKEVVLEEFMDGEEASVLGLCDGTDVVPLTPSQDHKPAFDNDQGPNTGGMGAYAPAPVVTPDRLEEIMERVMRPVVTGMAERGTPYIGVLYAGLMFTDAGLKVVEFNCRFGDPEIQVTLPLLKTDLVELIDACIDGILGQINLEFHDGASVIVVMASPGYPGSYPKGLPIHGVPDAEAIEGVTVFHAGTTTSNGQLVTAGGRVLGVTSKAEDIPSAIDLAYEGVNKIWFERQQAHFRHDIGHRALA